MPLPTPPAGFVRMTFASTGAEVYAPLEVYRSTWWPLGWRSIDDPAFVGTPVDDPDRFVVVPDGWGTHWRAAREEASSRIVRVQVWSDSIGAGQGATTPLTGGWPKLVASALQATYGDGGSGYVPWSLSNSSTGSWSSGFGFSGAMGTATAAASRSFTVRGTEVRIFHRTLGITGSFRYQVDGGGFTVVATPAGAVDPGVVVLTGLTDATHTVVVEWVSGTVSLHGIEARRPTGVIVQQCAQSGRAASDFSAVPIGRVAVGTTASSATISSAAPGAFTSTMVGRYLKNSNIPDDTTISAAASAISATLSAAAAGTGTAEAILSINPSSRPGVPGFTMEPPFGLVDGLEVPDVLIVCLGANDPGQANYDAQSFSDGLGAILRGATNSSTLTFSPDVVVIVEHFGTWIDVGQTWPELVGIMANTAAGHGAALVDVWGIGRRSWNYWDDLGMFADSIHPTDAGHAAYAGPVIDLLRS